MFFSGYYLLTMDRFPHQSLKTYLDTHGAIRNQDAALIIKQLVLAVRYMHDMGLVHRDLNVANVWIPDLQSSGMEKLSIKVVDFSYSCPVGRGSQLQAFVGDPLYHSPERSSGVFYGQSADIWSIGIIAHLLLTQNYPFYGESIEQIRDRIINCNPVLKNGLDRYATDFIGKCLMKDSNLRPTAA